MSKTQKPTRSVEWMTRAEVATMFKCDVTYVDRELRRLLPDDGERKDERGRVWINACELIAAWGNRREQVGRKSRAALNGTPAKAPTSGAERFRLARAELAELEVAKAKGQLLPAEEVRACLKHLVNQLRRLGERLGRQFGKPAQIALNDTLEQMKRDLRPIEGKEQHDV